ncbi:MAG: hypothetical protein JKY71_09125 [Alphaproteobacteria bacterium]|nr:hypothetical protein [Alphaproteobacteria bacterium]
MTKQQKQLPATAEDWKDAVRAHNAGQQGGYTTSGQQGGYVTSAQQGGFHTSDQRNTGSVRKASETRQMVYSSECIQQMG